MDREKKIKIKNKGTRTSRRARTKLANSPLALLFRPRTITRTSKNELKKKRAKSRAMGQRIHFFA